MQLHIITGVCMHVCSFHYKLKTDSRYLAHQVNKCIDDLVGALLVIEEDLLFDRKQKEAMKDSRDASTKQEGMQ